MKGKLPPTIFGHGHMKGTPEVPQDLVPEARPSKETFLVLPGTKDKMPQNGLGMCCRYSAYDDVLVRRTVLWYLMLGGRHIDGAHMYLNHEAIGLGIKDAMERGIPRKEIFVTTKISPYHFGYNATKDIVPTYVKELGLDYIDLILMHAPVTFPTMSNECTKNKIPPKDCRQQTWKALSELRKDGFVRNAGVSNFGIKHLKEIQEMSPDVVAPIANNQIQFSPFTPPHVADVVSYCHKHDITITAYSSLGGTLQHAEAQTVETLTGLATKYDKSVAQVMLRWVMQSDSNAAVIPGTGNPKHMRENLDIYSFDLSEQDKKAIDDLKHDEEAKKFFYVDPAEMPES